MWFRWNRLERLALVTVLTLAAPAVAKAQVAVSPARNHLYDKFQLSADFTTVLNNSSARVDGANGPGSDLEFKQALGIAGTSIQPALGVVWKPGHRTELQLGYQFINQTGTRLLDAPIVIGDDTIDADFNTTTQLGASNATLQFRYSLFAAPKHNIGLAVGFGSIFFNMHIDATANGCTPSECETGAVTTTTKLTGPTASLGAFGRWRLGESWYVGGDLRGIGATFGRFDISVLEGAAFGRHFLSDRWGIEAGWNYTDVSVDVLPKEGGGPAADFTGKITYRYSSLKLGVVAAF